MISDFKLALKIFTSDRKAQLLSLVPIVIGIVIYSFLGRFFFTDVLDYGNEQIKSWMGESEYLGFLTGILTFFATIIFLFIISYTFVLIVGLVAAPFNDLLSNRVEAALLGKEFEIANEFSSMFKRVGKIIFNEIKKIGFILILTVFSIICSFFFPPLAFAISAMLLAVSFIDYSWARRELSFQECKKQFMKNFLKNALFGAGFLFLFTIPIVNLIALPFGVILFTVLFVRSEHREEEISY